VDSSHHIDYRFGSRGLVVSTASQNQKEQVRKMLPTDYLFALILTIVIEVSIAAAFGYRSQKEILSIVLVNLITQPALNYFLLLNSFLGLIAESIQFILFLEILVIFVEWGLLVYTLKTDLRKTFVLSLVMNLASFVVGLLVFR
jgi:hypothetical protein